MKIIEPSYEILQCPDGEECLAFLELCARTCYKSEGKIDNGRELCPKCAPDGELPVGCPPFLHCDVCHGSFNYQAREPSSHKLIRSVLKRGHESVIEHMIITVKFICDRGVSHEIVRHRLCAFSQESTRYVRYDGDGIEGNEVTFIRPLFWSKEDNDPLPYVRWELAMGAAEEHYLKLLRMGAKPEEARSVLPNSLKTEIVVTANLREWRHILDLRTSGKAHPQMRQLMVPLWEELRRRIPILFDEIREPTVIPGAPGGDEPRTLNLKGRL